MKLGGWIHPRFGNRMVQRHIPGLAIPGLAILIGTAWLAAAGCSAKPKPPPNLVVIVVDTLRFDHLGAYGYERDTSPAIDALARDGVRFERAYSPSSWTQPSVASLFTGLYPSGHGVQRIFAKLPEEATTLAEILKQSGYATRGVVSHLILGKKFQYDQGFDVYDSEEGKGHDHISTPGVTEKALAALRDFETEKRPFFLFIHYFDPHFSYQHHPGTGYAPERVGRVKAGAHVLRLQKLAPPITSDEVAFLRNLYDEEIRLTDSGIGRVIDALKSSGRYQDTLVVVTADHGEEFYERNWLGHTHTLHEELIRVPYIVRLPGGNHAGKTVSDPVSTITLTATALDAMGIDPAPFGFQGRSLLPWIRGARERALPAIFSEVEFNWLLPPPEKVSRRSGDMRSVIRGDVKLMHDRATDRFELYDLASDPKEMTDLSQARSELLLEMKAELNAVHDAARAAGPRAAEIGKTSAEEAEMLKDLGYVED